MFAGLFCQLCILASFPVILVFLSLPLHRHPFHTSRTFVATQLIRDQLDPAVKNAKSRNASDCRTENFKITKYANNLLYILITGALDLDEVQWILIKRILSVVGQPFSA